MKHIRHFAVLACLGLFLVGCASPAEVKNMTVDQSTFVASVPDTPFKNGLTIKQVNGGEETNPLWTSEVSNSGFGEALKQSVQQSGLMAPTPLEARYDVYATLASMDQPLFGLDFQVTSRVNYRVIERETLKTWFDEGVVSSYTATFSDAALAIQRLRFANEGSIRENITEFIKRLMSVDKPMN